MPSGSYSYGTPPQKESPIARVRVMFVSADSVSILVDGKQQIRFFSDRNQKQYDMFKKYAPLTELPIARSELRTSPPVQVPSNNMRSREEYTQPTTCRCVIS